jgi:hypothetical protein
MLAAKPVKASITAVVASGIARMGITKIVKMVITKITKIVKKERLTELPLLNIDAAAGMGIGISGEAAEIGIGGVRISGDRKAEIRIALREF